ncbi:hypothetical protein LDJ79_21250 [Vibrio tritonius]|uniref:Lipoprotein n=1 Tax=Vibrio tritonius TaxID=1435069 RepID=A0ABS7YSP3_9VIBR|nr:hypothetical protein [Vibrio tritonius]MCA2018656.1 hypothetical protein [Vibrio tritonius]
MLKSILVSLFALSVLTGCFGEKSAGDFATHIVSLLNERDFNSLWDVTSPESQDAVKNQLNMVRGNTFLKQQVASSFNIPFEKLDSITPKEYFIAILNSDKTAGVIKTKIVDVEELDNKAKVNWVKGEKQGVSWLIKIDDSWFFQLDN